MAERQGRSPFETGTSPVVVVCIQLLAGSPRAHPFELTVPGDRGQGQQNRWGGGCRDKPRFLLTVEELQNCLLQVLVLAFVFCVCSVVLTKKKKKKSKTCDVFTAKERESEGLGSV